MELAAELLEVSNEQELEQFLGDFIKKAGKAIGGFVKSPIGQAIGGVLKSAANVALPIAGRTGVRSREDFREDRHRCHSERGFGAFGSEPASRRPGEPPSRLRFSSEYRRSASHSACNSGGRAVCCQVSERFPSPSS